MSDKKDDIGAASSAEEFEQLKWRREIELREREIVLKEREARPSIFKNALFLSAAAAVVGLIAHTAGDFGTKWMQSDDDSRRQQASLIQKAIEHEDPMRVIAKLKLLNEAGLVPDFSKSVKKLVDDDRGAQYFALPPDSGRQYQAALIQKAVEADDLTRIMKKLQLLDDADLIPDYSQSAKLRDILNKLREPVASLASEAASKSTPVAAAPPLAPTVVSAPPTPSATPSDACAGASASLASTGGWLFLGRMNKDKSEWVASDNGTRSIRFDIAPPERDNDLVQKLQGQCLTTLVTKYLREDSTPGQKVHAQVKRTIPARTRVRIVEIDADGIDEQTTNKYPVVWARVEVLRN